MVNRKQFSAIPESRKKAETGYWETSTAGWAGLKETRGLFHFAGETRGETTPTFPPNGRGCQTSDEFG